MKKRLLIILAVAILLVGCGNQQETNTPSTDIPTTTESTSTTEPTSTPTEEPTEPPHEHDYTESITTEASCEADGVKTFTCDCGDSYTEPIEATGHIYGDYVSNNDATYTADGTETATCVCGLTDTRTASGSKLEYTYTDLNKTMYAKSTVNVRNMPSTDGEKLGGLSKAQDVAVTGQCNETGWYRINYNGGTGYVSSDYLVNDKPVEETPAPNQSTNNQSNDSSCPYEVGVWNDMGWYCFKVCATEAEAKNLGHDYEYAQLIEGRYPGEIAVCSSGPTKWGYWVYVWQVMPKGNMVIPWSAQ